MWNAKLYDRFGKERQQPSIDLVNRIDIKNCKKIIDIGCGSGMSTLQLKNRFCNSEIIGVDLSEEMLKQAEGLVEGVQWVRRDCSKKLNDLGKFDIVFSNAFLQWLHNQHEFIMNTTELLNPDGVFAIQIPEFENMVISKVIKESAIELDKDNVLFKDIEHSLCFNYSLNEYYDMFSLHYSDLEIWQTNYIHQMKDHDSIIEFVKGTALIPYLERLNNEQTYDFIKLLSDKTQQLYPKSENGKVLFEFSRVFIIARK